MKRRTLLSSLSAPLWAGLPRPEVEPPRPSGGPTVSVDDFTGPGVSDAKAFHRALDACRERRAARLTLAARRYVFDEAEYGAGHLFLRDLSDLVIDGRGADLVFHRMRPGLVIRDCRRLLLSNFSMDWGVTLASLGRVIAVPGQGNAIQVLDEFPVKEDTPVGAVTEFDIQSRRWKMSAAEVYYPKNVRLIRPQVLYSESFAGGRPGQPLKPGMEALLRHYVYNAPGFEFGGAGNTDIAFEDVTVYRCPGHAWVSYGGGRGFRLTRCKIMRRPGSSHAITAAADGAHFGATRGNIIVEDCDFTLQGDDSINIHAAWLRIAGPPAGRKLALTSRWLRPELITPGAELTFHRPSNLEEYGSARVESCALDLAARRFQVTLDRDPPPGAAAGDYAANVDLTSSGFLIRNNRWHDHRARGMLLQARNGVVENNRIANVQAAALQITTDANYWQEGYGCRNLLIRGNTIEGCNYARWERGPKGRHMACINVIADTLAGLGDYPVHRGIRIEENAIRDTPGLAILIASARDVTVRGNRIIDANTEPFADTGAAIGSTATGTILVTRASAVAIEGNECRSTRRTFGRGIQVDSATTSGIKVGSNKGFDS